MPGKQNWHTAVGPGVALLLLGSVAAYPFFSGAGVPRTNDLVPHLHRAFALMEMVDLGYLWPRWAADLVHGYGYPVFNFFPALSHWVIVLWHLAGLPLLTAYKFTVWTHALITAAFAYGLGRAITGRDLGGWLVALIYTLSPYLLYDSIVRGSPPENQALACLPLLVWGIWRLMQPGKNHLKWGLVTAAAYAAMILSHHPVTLQISLMAAVWISVNWIYDLRFTIDELRSTKYEVRRTKQALLLKAGRPAGALLLGVVLSAFFALPALLEINATRATLSISQGYTYQENFLPLRELFRWPLLPADPARINPPVVRPLPLVGLAVTALCLPLAWPRLSPLRRGLTFSLGLTGLIGIWLITPLAAAAWRWIPLLEFTLYPWRMLGWISLIVAILAGMGVVGVVEKFNSKWVYWCIGILVTVLTGVEAVPWLFPPREPLPVEISQATVSNNELPPFLIGTTTLGEFLPVGVEELPDTTALKNELLIDGNPDRLQPQAGVSWERHDNDPTDARYTIMASSPASLTYRQFYFPGWQVQVNGQAIPITTAASTGLITFELPAGTHNVRLRFGTTPVRTLGTTLSALAAAAWGVGFGYLVVRPQTSDYRLQNTFRESSAVPVYLQPKRWGLLSVVCSLFLVGLVTLVAVVDSPLRRPTLLANGVWGERPIDPLDFAGEVRLLSFDVSQEAIAADEIFTLTTFWEPQRNIGVEYLFGVQVVDENGLPWQAHVTRPLDWRFIGGAEIWPLDSYRLEPFEITLLDGTPPGTYRFLMGLVRSDTGQTVATHQFGTLTVVEPATGDRPLEPGMFPIEESAGGVTLLGLKPDRGDARPGDPLRMGVLWQRQTEETASFVIQLIDEAGRLTWESPPLTIPDGPPGSRLRVDDVFRLPAGLPGGIYRWQLNWAGGSAAAGDLTVTAPERVLETPPIQEPIDVQFAEVARLVGWTPCTFDGPACELELVWQAAAETAASYRIFVHLVDADGTIIAQSDGEPASWTRPTTGWLPPEYIVDRHSLPLPEPLPNEELSVRIGLYNPETGDRLRIEGRKEFVELKVES